MTTNVGARDRALRLIAALPLTVCAFAAPFPLALRLAVLAVPALYLAITSLTGTCLGYAVLGRSTCPAGPRSGARGG